MTGNYVFETMVTVAWNSEWWLPKHSKIRYNNPAQVRKWKLGAFNGI